MTSRLCRARRYADEETVKRVLYAIRLNGRRMTGCGPRRCGACGWWHIAKGKING